ncbi:hypothetical protein H2200_001084 [Cladophialophora chaetospira]|uniref:Uncharacterized protein n=1 Tax=Cladophialophora chaetospira TaxID=386627 RepID=A0AA39CP94_9EURO|nr:hypothetical protein H2200_001084 [Cladophialophora chaetospira]
MSVTKGTWDTGEQIREHKLACSVINLHGTEDCVFDQTNLDLLKRFTDDISIGNRNEILMEMGWTDPPGSRPGESAVNKNRSLSGLLIARYGTDEPALDERDWQLLKEWNDQGMPRGQHVRR